MMPSIAWIFLAFAAVLVVTACGLKVRSVGSIEFQDHEFSSPFAALLGATVLGALGLLLPLDHGGKALLPVLVSDAEEQTGPSATSTLGTSSGAVASTRPGAVPTVPPLIDAGTVGRIQFPRFDLDAAVSPTSGSSGDRLTITGSGCEAGEKVEIRGLGPQLLAVVRADSTGAFRATAKVPDWFEGLQEITFVCVSSRSSGSGEFTVR